MAVLRAALPQSLRAGTMPADTARRHPGTPLGEDMSLQARLIQASSRLLIKRRPRDMAKAVRHFRRVARPLFPTLLPRGFAAHDDTVGGVPCARLRGGPSARSILYLHGGGFVAGRPETYFNFSSRLGALLGAEALLPRYRLAPEHPFPAAVEDALAVYRALLDEGREAADVVVVGDSAGGCLVLSLLLAAREAGLPLPAAGCAISPVADQAYSGGSYSSNDRSDPMLTEAIIGHFRQAYTPTPEQQQDPLASPLRGDFAGLPPLLLTVSQDECLYDHSLQVAAKAREAGVPVALLERPGLVHIWPVLVPYLPEAREDLRWIADRLRAALDGAGSAIGEQA